MVNTGHYLKRQSFTDRNLWIAQTIYWMWKSGISFKSDAPCFRIFCGILSRMYDLRRKSSSGLDSAYMDRIKKKWSDQSENWICDLITKSSSVIGRITFSWARPRFYCTIANIPNICTFKLLCLFLVNIL